MRASRGPRLGSVTSSPAVKRRDAPVGFRLLFSSNCIDGFHGHGKVHCFSFIDGSGEPIPGGPGVGAGMPGLGLISCGVLPLGDSGVTSGSVPLDVRGRSGRVNDHKQYSKFWPLFGLTGQPWPIFITL